MPTVDLPDFWQSSVVDIIQQELAELVARLKYGSRGVLEYSDFVGASGVTSLGIITGKGIIYGGVVAVSGVATCKGDKVGSNFDSGGQLFCPTFEQGIGWNLTGQHGATWQLECYDETNFLYAAGLSFGITFEETAQFLYTEAAGRNPYIVTKIMYAVI